MADIRKLAIIGASYLQVPLINKAKDMGVETHVFAWETGDVGESLADFFYPVSIVEKEQILDKCREVKIDGITSIASDLASITVNYVASQMGLVGNTMECTRLSTNKHSMRKAFEVNGDPSPKSYIIGNAKEMEQCDLKFPVIIKPTDRSGSRGITKVYSDEDMDAAIRRAQNQSFERKALVEEFVEGQEYSVECISYKGKHHFLAITQKYTTGSPQFIETGHLEPASIDNGALEKVKNIVFHALDSLKITDSASHTEIKIAEDGTIKIIEVGARMGGDCIGSHLVELSTGIDFVKAVIRLALGEKPDLAPSHEKYIAAVRYIFDQNDLKIYEKMMRESSEKLVTSYIRTITDEAVIDSSSRLGMFIMKSKDVSDILMYLPEE